MKEDTCFQRALSPVEHSGPLPSCLATTASTFGNGLPPTSSSHVIATGQRILITAVFQSSEIIQWI